MQSKASGARRGERLYNFNALPPHPQADIKKRDQSDPERKTCEHKFLSVSQHFSEKGVRRQIDESAAHLRHDQAEPKNRNLCEKKIADHAAEKGGCFNRGHPPERRWALQSRTNQ